MKMKKMHAKPIPFSFFLSVTIYILILFPNPANSALVSVYYAGCSPVMYNPGTPYESTVSTVLTSLIDSAAFSNFNNYSLPIPNQHDAVYALFQCQGDLSNSDCQGCVMNAANQLRNRCVWSKGGVFQLEGCYVRYDNVSFFGVEEKNVALDRCGPGINGGDESEFLAMRDGALNYLVGGGPYFRVTGNGRVQAMAQCVQDLSASECQDCLSEAIQRLRTECGTSGWGDMFLGKCYVRFTGHGYSNNDHSSNRNQTNSTDRNIAIIIGIVAGLVLLIAFLSYCSKKFDKRGDK